MPPDRLVYFIVTVPVLLCIAWLLLASPWYALFAFLSATNARVRACAALLFVAWLVAAIFLALFFLSGFWYRENTAIHPVAPEEYLMLGGLIVVGVLLPGFFYRRLVASRSTDAGNGR